MKSTSAKLIPQASRSRGYGPQQIGGASAANPGAMAGLHDLHPDTIAVHGDRTVNSSRALSPPIFQTSAFRAADAAEFARSASEPQSDSFYTRYGNPNHTQAATVIAKLERAQAALIFPSGMAALTAAILAACKQGDHVLAHRGMYAGTQTLLNDVLAPLGIACTLMDQTRVEDFAAAIRPETRLAIVETPSNPVLTVTDLRAVAALARKRGVLTIADNTFATPINQLPLSYGIDIVMHSATKYLGGHSDLSAGALASTHELIERMWNVSVKLGFAMNGFDSWLLLRGLRTLALRIERQNANALAIAEFLHAHAGIATVHYPGLKSHPQHALACAQMNGFGGIVSFELASGKERIEHFLLALGIIARAPSLGGVESTLVHQRAMWSANMTDEQWGAAGIPPSLLRLSCGIEHPADLIADLQTALESVTNKE